MGEGDADDWRRLKACPGCDYSLETLPAEGTCPECGRRYDQRLLSPDGVAQVASTPEARRAQWVTENASWLFLLVMCVGLLFAAGRRPGAVTLILGVSALLVGAATMWWLRRRSTGDWDAAGDAPRLRPWGAVEKIEVNVLPKGRARVRCQVMRRWGTVAVNRLWMVDIELGCTADEAEGLRRQMLRWAGRPDGEE